MPFAFGVLGVAAVHFVVSFFVSFAAGISTSLPLKIAAGILTFPLSYIPNTFNLPGWANWLPWVLLSLCWGFAVCSGVRLAVGGRR